MMDFDAFSAGQTHFEDSESDSNFTSDEFDSECADDMQQDHYIPYSTAPIEPEIESEPSIAQQLLHFAEMVNKDIQKYFGKRKAVDDVDHDAEDVCKDRFASGKSGRELYYADLLKVAHGGGDNSTDLNQEPQKKQPERIIISNKDGYWDNKLGPLGELFEHASSVTSTTMHPPTQWNNYHHTEKHRTAVPWRKRTLPRSFFIEPQTSPQQTEQRSRHGLAAQDPPDFSDLMAAAADD